MSKFKPLPLPEFYDEKNCYDDSYQRKVDLNFQEYANKWRKSHNIEYSSNSKYKVVLLSIDNQRDFIFPSGSLFVAGKDGKGAMNDQNRLAKFAYKYLHIINKITNSLDTHFLYQIFFGACHLDTDGFMLKPNTIITYDDYKQGKYRVNPAVAKEFGMSPPTLQKQFMYYMKELERQGKYKLYIWDYHTMQGTPGNNLSGVIDEFTQFHRLVRGAFNLPEIKGGSPFTEHYSIIQPEVTTFFDGSPLPGVQKNTRLLKDFLDATMLIIAGQAGSHCVPASVDHVLTEIKSQDENLAKKVYILKDCMSPVVIPGVVDYSQQQEETLKRFEDNGMNVVSSETPIEEWPNFPLG